MQVQQLVEPTSHLVLGGQSAREMKIANSASVFRHMSNTLYRDKKRAVVREVLCNADDAHIAAGTPHRPVEVTVTDTELVIKDYGPGIPDGRIIEIYGTLFGSTKEEDERQTGGFGLGSKAPFAYAEHFTAISRYDGLATTYAIHLGGVAKPLVRAMASVPCDDTGLTVTVPLQPGDRAEFERLVREIATDGGILTLLNGTRLSVPDFTEARERGFCLERTGSGIRVLYGKVLYPLDSDKRLAGIVSKLESLRGDAGGRLILCPVPGSVSVVPSRESLSYDDPTIAALLKLMRRVAHEISTPIPGMMRNMRLLCVRAAGRERLAPHELARAAGNLPTPERSGLVTDPELIASIVARVRVGRAFASIAHYHDPLLANAGDMVDAALDGLREHRSDLKLLYVNPYKLTLTDLAMRRQLRRLTRIMASAGVTGKLYARSYGRAVSFRSSPAADDGRERFAYCSKLYVANSATAASASTEQASCILVVPKITQTMLEALTAAAKRFRMELVDITAVKPPPRPKPVEKVAAGTYPKLMVKTFYSTSNGCSYAYLREFEPTTQPAAMYTCRQAVRDCNPVVLLPDGGLAAALIRAIGGDIAIVQSRKEAELLAKAGVPTIEEVVIGRLEARCKRTDALPTQALYYDLGRVMAGDLDNKHSYRYALPRLFGFDRRVAFRVLGLRHKESAEEDQALLDWVAARALFASPAARLYAGGGVDAPLAKLIGLASLIERYDALVAQVEPHRRIDALSEEAYAHLDAFDLDGVRSSGRLERMLDLIDFNRKLMKKG